MRLLASPWFALALAVGAVLVVAFQTWIWLRVRSQFGSWQPVAATIVESRVHSYTDMNDNYVREPRIRFSYSWQGIDYVSETPLWRSFTLGPEFVDLTYMVDLYREGEQVTARLHPDNPNLCFIGVARFDFKSVVLLGGGLVLAAAAAFAIQRFIGGDF